MIPSVQERKKNVHVFMSSYPHLCRLQNTIPNPNIKIDSSNKSLDFVGDRLKFDDWKPVLEAISNDRSLHFISIRSRHVNAKPKVPEKTDSESEVRQNGSPKSFPLLTHYILTKLTEALSSCLSDSPALTGLVLEKIPLNLSALMQLTKGLEMSQSLQHLSLAYSQIGDDDCAGLCHVLRHRLNLITLNLTGCGLTERGVGMLCNLLKFQKLNRYGESWKQSLRYRPVNPNVMPGLRRITLNHNPIGDNGVQILVDTLIDDLWLKALDLQHCSVTMVGAEALLNLVKENKFLSVVDIRGNLQVPNSLVAAVVQQLAENNGDAPLEFQWLTDDSAKSNARSNSATTVSRSTQRLLSNTTISSKALSSVLPSRMKLGQPSVLPTRTRSASAKRSKTDNQTPRPPWNWNLKKGKSGELLRTSVKSSDDVALELQSVKMQLNKVLIQLEEEKERRIKIEEELEKYRSFLEIPDGSMSVNQSMLQTVLSQLYNGYLNERKVSMQSPRKNEFTLPPPSEKNKSQNERQSPRLKKHDSLESVIRTINGENHSNMEVIVQNCNSLVSSSCDSKSDVQDGPSRAQLIFESLISS